MWAPSVLRPVLPRVRVRVLLVLLLVPQVRASLVLLLVPRVRASLALWPLLRAPPRSPRRMP
jgi:hypothetical protein